MRISRVLKAVCSAACLPLLLAVPSRSQQPASPSPEPSDPKALMLLAAKRNNLTTSDLIPWHIKASFQLFDDKGAPAKSGAFEEFWAGENKFKRIFSISGLTQVEYGSDKGILRVDSQDDLDPSLVLAADEFTNPLPTEKDLGAGSFTNREMEAGAAKLECIHHDPGGPDYCVGLHQPILRISVIGPDLILRNRILGFQNHFVPGDLKIARAGLTVLTLHIDTIEALSPGFDFTPPANAKVVPRLVNLPGNLAEGMIEYRVAPEYPEAAKRANITGTVVLRGIIGKDGRIHNLRAISGPEALQGSAIQAVQQWRYRPYLLNGQPVAVMTTVNVIFAR